MPLRTPFHQQGMYAERRKQQYHMQKTTIIDKLKAEEGNLLTVKVYGNRGVFANAYERSAYAAWRHLKFKPNVHRNRDAGTEYISIGIPNGKAEELLRKHFGEVEVQTAGDGTSTYTATLPLPLFTEEDFLQWKKGVIADAAKDSAGGGRKETDGKKGAQATAAAGETVTETPASPAAPATEGLPARQAAGDSRLTPETIAEQATKMAIRAEKRLALYEPVVRDILGLQLSEITPMQALNYLNDIQQRIRNGQ